MMTIDENDNIEFTDEEMERLTKMLRCISWKYNGWSGLLAEDIEMELWRKTLEVLRDCRSMEWNLIARCAYNKSLDLCRKAKKDKDNTFSASHLLDCVGENEKDSKFASYTEEDYYSNLVIQEMLDLFEPESKEHRYISLMIKYMGLLNIKSDHDFGENRRELEIAHSLGYVNDTSNGYRKMKNRVRETLVYNGYHL